MSLIFCCYNFLLPSCCTALVELKFVCSSSSPSTRAPHSPSLKLSLQERRLERARRLVEVERELHVVQIQILHYVFWFINFTYCYKLLLIIVIDLFICCWAVLLLCLSVTFFLLIVNFIWTHTHTFLYTSTFILYVHYTHIHIPTLYYRDVM